jgi:hypothetical protein
MGGIFSLQSHRKKRFAERGFREWRRIFQSFVGLDEHTRWVDLPDEMILFFCEESPESRNGFYDLLMSARHGSSGHDFESQPFDKLTTLLNAYFFLSDQARFECMRRLGWVDGIPGGDCSIVDVVLDSQTYEYTGLMETPAPTPQHPAYDENLRSWGMDRAALVRKYTPQALELFRDRLGRGRVPAL